MDLIIWVKFFDKDRSLTIIDHSLTIIDRSFTIIDRLLIIVDHSLTIIDRSLTIIDYSLAIIDYSLTIIDRSLTIIYRLLTIIGHSLAIIDRSLDRSLTFIFYWHFWAAEVCSVVRIFRCRINCLGSIKHTFISLINKIIINNSALLLDIIMWAHAVF